MTSPQRGPAPHPQVRGDGAGATLAAQRLNRSERRQPVGGVERGQAEHRPQFSPQAEEALRAALTAAAASRSAVRYRGFVLLPQPDLGWLVRPERSPMTVLPFRTPPISLSDVKALVDWRLDGAALTPLQRPRRAG